MRNNVALALKHDEKLLNEFRWTNRTDLKPHFSSLTGYYVDDEKQLRLDDEDIKYFRTIFVTASLPSKYRDMKGRKGIDDMGNEVELTDHHIISKAEIRSQRNAFISTLTDEQLKAYMKTYLNDPGNASNKTFTMKELAGLKSSQNPSPDNLAQLHSEIRRRSVIWNPNNLVPGPPGEKCSDHCGSATDKEILSEHNSAILYDPNLNILQKLTLLEPDSIEPTVWKKNKHGKFFYSPNSSGKGTYSFPRLPRE